jgi:hypothetical protein
MIVLFFYKKNAMKEKHLLFSFAFLKLNICAKRNKWNHVLLLHQSMTIKYEEGTQVVRGAVHGIVVATGNDAGSPVRACRATLGSGRGHGCAIAKDGLYLLCR